MRRVEGVRKCSRASGIMVVETANRPRSRSTSSPPSRRLTPNPPMDGVRTLERGEEVTDATVRARIRVNWRLVAVAGAFGGADGDLQWLWRARWRDRTRQEALADRTGASWRGRSVGRRRVSGGRAPSGWEWNGSQPDQGAAELLPHGQRSGRCRVNLRAERVSRPAREKNRRRRVLVVTICSPRPIRAVQRGGLTRVCKG